MVLGNVSVFFINKKTLVTTHRSEKRSQRNKLNKLADVE